MYLSTLLIDVGDNPDRPRPGRLWLRNVYRIHQRLAMAFPSAQRRRDDPEMLKPYDPKHFSDGQVHVPRDGAAGFLFRIDPQPGGRVVILVLSAQKPDWDYAFGLKPGLVDPRTNRPIGNAGYLLAAPPSEPRALHLPLAPGVRLRFCLLANPVHRVSRNSKDERDQPIAPKWHGKRVPVSPTEESLRKWLEDRAEPRWSQRKRNPAEQSPGFRIIKITDVQAGYVYINGTGGLAKGQRLRSVRYNGLLEVTDPAAFSRILAAGIGPAKGFGFGLLSVAPA